MQIGKQEFNSGLGFLIRSAREKQGLSQRDLAQKMGLTFQQMHKYESGQSLISLYRLYQISEVLGVSFGSYISFNFPEYEYKILPKEKIKSILKNLQNDFLQMIKKIDLYY